MEKFYMWPTVALKLRGWILDKFTIAMLAALDLTPETAADVDSKRNLKHLLGRQLPDWDYCRHGTSIGRGPTRNILSRTQIESVQCVAIVGCSDSLHLVDKMSHKWLGHLTSSVLPKEHSETCIGITFIFLPWYFEVCVPEATPGTDGQLAPVCLGGLSLGLIIIIIVIITIVID